MNPRKPFEIPKEIVWEAYKRVKENKGVYGVDEVSIQDFEINLKGNLYKLWNRMSSGSYFPSAVRTVEIPKKDGSKRPLGIPTVADRIAQTAVKMILEPKVEPHFHSDSYGFRPKKSAHEALGVTRQRCWRYDWVLDVDIQGFFDNLDHTLLMKAVRKHTDSKWIHLYIERWLKAPAQAPDGTQVIRDKGTPQGGVISPLLANIFLHYAFDEWMRRNYASIPFERYADDIVVHLKSQAQADMLKCALTQRLAECRLELNPQKTKVVYCKDEDRQGPCQDIQFDFLGYTFRPRKAKNRKTGRVFCSFTPGVSSQAVKKMRSSICNWHLRRHGRKTLHEIADFINPVTRGWINYYGKFHKSALYPVFRHQLECHLVKWSMNKYKKLRRCPRRTRHWLKRIAAQNPMLFAHWQIVYPRQTARTIRAV